MNQQYCHLFSKYSLFSKVEYKSPNTSLNTLSFINYFNLIPLTIIKRGHEIFCLPTIIESSSNLQ